MERVHADRVKRDEVLIVAALEDELQQLPQRYRCLVTGIGKVNAAIRLTEALVKGPRPSLVLNLGSAGSHCFATGELVEATRFVQHDMDVRGLGFAIGETPLDPLPAVLEVEPRFGLPIAVCASGDRFVQERLVMECDVVDMEAYALAKVCYIMDASFACVKYITDGADHSAHNDWATNVKLAARKFEELLEKWIS